MASPRKKSAANKSAAKKPAAKKPARTKPSAAKKSPRNKRSATRKYDGSTRHDIAKHFSPLTEGERADTLRILLEDDRLAAMAKVGRYRVIAVEPIALKGSLADARRVARTVIYDYSADRCVEANVDLDSFEVSSLSVNRSQPMLAEEEEVAAMEVAIADSKVQERLCMGEVPIAAMHYWSHRPADLSHNRRTAAVLLGEPGARPRFVALVDLLDAQVTEIVAGSLW